MPKMTRDTYDAVLAEARDAATSPERVLELARHPNATVMETARRNPNLPSDYLRRLLEQGDIDAWMNPQTLIVLFTDPVSPGGFLILLTEVFDRSYPIMPDDLVDLIGIGDSFWANVEIETIDGKDNELRAMVLLKVADSYGWPQSPASDRGPLFRSVFDFSIEQIRLSMRPGSVFNGSIGSMIDVLTEASITRDEVLFDLFLRMQNTQKELAYESKDPVFLQILMSLAYLKDMAWSSGNEELMVEMLHEIAKARGYMDYEKDPEEVDWFSAAREAKVVLYQELVLTFDWPSLVPMVLAAITERSSADSTGLPDGAFARWRSTLWPPWPRAHASRRKLRARRRILNACGSCPRTSRIECASWHARTRCCPTI